MALHAEHRAAQAGMVDARQCLHQPEAALLVIGQHMPGDAAPVARLARRTIAKYREALQIPPVNVRKAV